MAKAITDSDKYKRRLQAAIDVYGKDSPIAKVFKSRSFDLLDNMKAFSESKVAPSPATKEIDMMLKFTKKEISDIKLLRNLALHTEMGEPLKVKSTREISVPYLGTRSFLSRMISYFAGLKSAEFAAHQDEFYIDDYDFVYRDNAFFTFKPDTYTFDELVDIVVKYAEKRSDKASLDESTLYEGYFSRIADKLADVGSSDSEDSKFTNSGVTNLLLEMGVNFKIDPDSSCVIYTIDEDGVENPEANLIISPYSCTLISVNNEKWVSKSKDELKSDIKEMLGCNSVRNHYMNESVEDVNVNFTDDSANDLIDKEIHSVEFTIDGKEYEIEVKNDIEGQVLFYDKENMKCFELEDAQMNLPLLLVIRKLTNSRVYGKDIENVHVEPWLLA